MKKIIFIPLLLTSILFFSQKKTSEKINNVNQQANETTDALEEVSNTADRVVNFWEKIFSKKMLIKILMILILIMFLHIQFS